MRTFAPEQEIFDAQADHTAEFTVNASTNRFSSTAHGLAVNDVITLTNSGGALPTGLSAATYYYVIEVIDADTFKVSTTPGGSTADPSDTGSGTHSFHEEYEGAPILVSDWKSLMLTVHTSDSASVTLYAKVAIADTKPTFINPASESNRTATVMLINLEDATGVEGDDGIVIAGTDIAKAFKVNVDGAMWFTLVTKLFNAGQVTAKIKGLHE